MDIMKLYIYTMGKKKLGASYLAYYHITTYESIKRGTYSCLR